MLTLGWAVDQSRRAFRAKSRGSRVHPDGRRTASSSRGGDGTPGTPTRGAPRGNGRRGRAGPKSPRRPPGAGPGTCLGAVIALMGFGRGGTKAIAAAEARAKPLGAKLRGVPRASTPEHRATPSSAGARSARPRASGPSPGGTAARPGRPRETTARSRAREGFRLRRVRRRCGSRRRRVGMSRPSRRGLWNDPSPASRARRFRARRRARVFRRTRARAGSGTTAGTVYGRHTRHAGSSSRRRPRTETSRRLGGDESRGWERRAG